MGTEQIRSLVDEAKRMCAASAGRDAPGQRGTPPDEQVLFTLRRLTAATEELLAVIDGYSGRLRRSPVKPPPAGTSQAAVKELIAKLD